MTTVPYSWLKQIPASLLEAHEIMPFGVLPTFPWEQFSAVFAKVFQLDAIKFESSNWQLTQTNDLYSQLGSHPVALHCDLSPLEGTFWLLMAKEDREKLMSLLLTHKIDGEVIDEEYQKAFTQFLALELFAICNKLDYQKDLTPHLLETDALPHEVSYTQDILIHYSGSTFLVRLIASEELRISWKERFAERSLSIQLSKDLAEKIKFTLHLEGGSTALYLSDWKKIAVGDLLLLDQSSLEIDNGKGSIMISLFQQPFFLAQLQEGKIKIKDYPLYHEAPIAMPTYEDNDDDDLDEFDLDSTFSDEFTEETDHSGETTAAESVRTRHTESDIDENETASLHDSTTEETVEGPPPVSAKTDESTKSALPFEHSASKPLNVQNLPVNVVVEIGRIEMTIQKLIELQPGSMLDLNISPEDGVDLTINGQIVAKGELLKIGDSLGVRILDKG